MELDGIDIQKKSIKNKQHEDLSENDHYLRLISDVNTHWNSSYLAWRQLDKIRDYIDIMVITMSRNSDTITRKDERRLNKINLNEDDRL
ncbi:hypothetical protein RclHR1_01250010 [Rhizophagus clarus]|uniref:Uncharacterized protein n=1 Tax=Rhizophagus clarus TaxID=94130 RepID=A0A2Z6Q798_9GLOM|nr:hypothetical protein RclHR1_01250010 [Rhizophagus clarus]